MEQTLYILLLFHLFILISQIDIGPIRLMVLHKNIFPFIRRITEKEARYYCIHTRGTILLQCR